MVRPLEPDDSALLGGDRRAGVTGLIPYRDTCADCGHEQVHHGHLAPNDKPTRWVDEGKCWVWVPAERTASGRKRGQDGCKCKGWRA